MLNFQHQMLIYSLYNCCPYLDNVYEFPAWNNMYIIYIYIIYKMGGTQNKEKTYSNYAVWNNVPFVISYRSFLLVLQVFLIIPQIQVLQSSPEFYIEAMSFFIVCRMGTTHPTKIIWWPKNNAKCKETVLTKVFTSKDWNYWGCPVA